MCIEEISTLPFYDMIPGADMMARPPVRSSVKRRSFREEGWKISRVKGAVHTGL